MRKIPEALAFFFSSVQNLFIEELSRQDHLISQNHHPLYKEMGSSFLLQQKETLEQIVLLLLQERFDLVRQVGKYKKIEGLEALAPGRWKEMLNKKIQAASQLNLNSEFVTRFFDLIHQEALSIQNEILKS